MPLTRYRLLLAVHHRIATLLGWWTANRCRQLAKGLGFKLSRFRQAEFAQVLLP